MPLQQVIPLLWLASLTWREIWCHILMRFKGQNKPLTNLKPQQNVFHTLLLLKLSSTCRNYNFKRGIFAIFSSEELNSVARHAQLGYSFWLWFDWSKNEISKDGVSRNEVNRLAEYMTKSWVMKTRHNLQKSVQSSQPSRRLLLLTQVCHRPQAK